MPGGFLAPAPKATPCQSTGVVNRKKLVEAVGSAGMAAVLGVPMSDL